MIDTIDIEELKKNKIISNTEGRPTSTLTDEKWQKEFEIRRSMTIPFSPEQKRFGGKYSRCYEKKGIANYCGMTNYQQYCRYINDVAMNIRKGKTDYCYFIYQIIDLLKMFKDNLRTRYSNGYWTVWLE